ncbi:MAG: hypothetical protein K6E10_10330 [Eubacterium sp.]|nr:hypothetical protein [Eubacterium sp.]
MIGYSDYKIIFREGNTLYRIECEKDADIILVDDSKIIGYEMNKFLPTRYMEEVP